MKRFKSTFSVICLALCCLVSNARAQDLTLTSVENALSEAMARNTDLQNFALRMQQAELEYKQAKSYRKPQVSATFNGQKNLSLATTPLPGEIFGQPGQTVDAQFGQEYTYNAGINISKNLLNEEARFQAKLTKLNTKITATEQAIFEQSLKEQVGLYYYTSLVAQRAVTIAGQDLDAAQSLVKLAEEKFKDGLIDAMSLNQASINENAVKQQLNASRQLATQCSIALKKLMGLTAADQLIIDDSLQADLPGIYLVNQLNEDPLLASAGLDLEQAELQLKLSQAALLPEISMNNYNGKQQFQDNLALGFGEGDWSNYSYLSLNLTVPIFNGFSKRSKINQSKIGRQIAERERESTVRQVSLDDEMLLADYHIARQDAEALKDSYERYRQNRELTFQKYEEGLIGFDQYLSVFEDYLRAENNYLNALSKLYGYYSEIKART